jgi:hypothetical protein
VSGLPHQVFFVSILLVALAVLVLDTIDTKAGSTSRVIRTLNGGAGFLHLLVPLGRPFANICLSLFTMLAFFSVKVERVRLTLS